MSLAAEDPIVGELQRARGGDREAMGCLLESCRGYLRIVAERKIDVSSGMAAGLPFPCLTVTPGGQAAREEQAAALSSALGRIPEHDRRVVVWHQYDRLTFDAIGRRLGRSTESVRKLWSRVLIRLSQELGPAHDLGI